MLKQCFAFILIVDSLRCVSSNTRGFGEPVVYFPPFELRAVSNQRGPPLSIPIRDPLFNDVRHPKLIQTHIHNSAPVPIEEPEPDPEPAPKQEIIAEKATNHNHTISAVHDLLAALGLTDKEKNKSREATDAEDEKTEKRYPYESYQQDYGYHGYQYPDRGYDYGPDHGYSHGYEHGYSHGPDRGYWHSKYPHSYGPPTYVHQHIPPPPPPPQAVAKPDKLSALLALKPLVKPVVSAVKPVIGDKIISVLGAFKSFLGKDFTGSPVASSLLTTLVEGIIKPLFTAKAAVKSLIGKLAVPVIVLVLVNVELLILMWWLWEDCKTTVVAAAPEYHYPSENHASPYNPYSAYRQSVKQ